MKIYTIIFLSLLITVSTSQYSFAQQQNVSDLIGEYGALLHPSADDANNTLSYTQAYVELKKKVDALSADDKTAFQNGIKKYSSESGYAELNNMLFGESSGTSEDVPVGKDAGGGAAVSTGNVADSSMTVEVYDRRHKLLKSYKIVPTDLDSKMTADGLELTSTSVDLTKQTASITYARTDGSGTAKVSFTTSGDCDVKYKIAQGPSVAVHSAAGGSPTLKVTKAKK